MREKPQQKATYCGILLCEVSRGGESIQRRQGPRQGEKRTDFSMGASLLLGAGDAQELDYGDVLDTGNVPNATELDTLAWLTW